MISIICLEDKIQKMMTFTAVLFYFIISFLIFSVRATCKLNTTSEISKYSPLMFNGSNFVYPSRQSYDIVTFCNNQTQEFYCSDGFFEVVGSKFHNSYLTLTCKNERTFTVENNMRSFNEIRCSKSFISTTRKVGVCPNGEMIEIGFRLSEEKFATTIDLCFDTEAGKTTWAHAIIPGCIRSRGRGAKRRQFRAGGHWTNIRVAEAYKKKTQIQQFMKIFDSNETLVNYYIKNKGEYFLSRGHLIAKADKFYNIEQESTFHYVNALPTWQIVNSGNWAIVEETIRALASENGDVHVWVGGLDNLSLPDASCENKLVYLANHRVTKTPVLVPPKFLFKLIYHEPTHRAMVYVTINNPYLSFEHLPDEYRICEEYTACRGGGRKFKNIKLGYTYCCTYDDFMKDRSANGMGLPALHYTSPLV